jgi:hypothetical protein
MNMNIAKRVIIQPRTPACFFVKLKAKRFDQMQTIAAICRQPDNIAGVGRNLRRK